MRDKYREKYEELKDMDAEIMKKCVANYDAYMQKVGVLVEPDAGKVKMSLVEQKAMIKRGKHMLKQTDDEINGSTQ